MSPNRQWLLPVASSAGGSGGGAPLNSPAFTGTPTAPTASPLTDNTQLATTAYVDTATGGSQIATATVTPTQLGTLNGTTFGSTFITLLAAPGTGKMFLVENYMADYQYGGTAYSASVGPLNILYVNSSAVSGAA